MGVSLKPGRNSSADEGVSTKVVTPHDPAREVAGRAEGPDSTHDWRSRCYEVGSVITLFVASGKKKVG